MIIAAGLIAKKVSSEKAKRKEAKEARQGRLQVGDSQVAKTAFENPAIVRSETDIKFEDPNDVSVTSPDSVSPTLYSPKVEVQDVRHKSQVNVASPVQSERAGLGPARGSVEKPRTPIDHDGQRSRSSTGPPPYSPNAESATSSLQATTTADSKSERSDTSSTVHSTASKGTYAVRVKTKGNELKSGFPYHPGLFDLRVHPEKWDSFSSEIVSATKATPGDTAKVWAAATGCALTGRILTGIYVGRNLERQLKEQRVKEGLSDTASGSLGDKLNLWNEEYFSKQGLFAHLELSESAMKKEGRSTPWRKPTAFYTNDAERDRKREERKFVIVITKLDGDGQPSEALRELASADPPVEIGSSGIVPTTAELPAEVVMPVELPAEEVVELPADTPSMVKDTNQPHAYVEMDGDNSRLLEKMHFENELDSTRIGGAD